jgi:hypothetical protein
MLELSPEPEVGAADVVAATAERSQPAAFTLAR